MSKGIFFVYIATLSSFFFATLSSYQNNPQASPNFIQPHLRAKTITFSPPYHQNEADITIKAHHITSRQFTSRLG